MGLEWGLECGVPNMYFDGVSAPTLIVAAFAKQGNLLIMDKGVD